MTELLEREAVLADLRDRVRRAAPGPGGVVLLGGEAGIGKTSVVRSLAWSVDGTVWQGTCDPAETPRPLGPFLDMAADAAGLAELLADAAGGDLAAGLAALLTGPDAPTLVVVEDVHWADQASLDLLRFLGRRAERLRTLLVATFRDDAAAPSPLTVLLGDLATAPGVHRVTLPPLSRAAAARLVADTGIDAGTAFDRTGGNPFFLTALVAAGGDELPATVRDAVLARIARLSPPTRDAVRAAAALGPRADPHVLAPMLDALGIPRWTMRDAVLAGMLRWHGPLLEFRHELAQQAVARSTPGAERQRLHAAAYGVLRDVRPDALTDLVRHAEAAGAEDDVRDLALRAAAHAAARDAHREAAALYRKAADRTRDGGRAELVEREAGERYLAGELGAAAGRHREAAALFTSRADALGASRNLLRAAALGFLSGADPTGAAAGADDVASALAELPPSRELAMAYENRSRQEFMSGDPAAARHWAERAAEAATAVHDADLLLAARVSHGGALLLADDAAGAGELRTALAAARDAGLADHAARAILYLGWLPVVHRRYDGVEAYLDEGGRYADEHRLPYWRQLIDGARLRLLLDTGRWAEAERLARDLLADAGVVSLTRAQALVGLGRLHARRGVPDDCLDQAARLAAEHPRTEPIALALPARAEAAWLAGDDARVATEVETALAGGLGAGNPWWHGELAFWAHRAAAAVAVDGPLAEPYALAVAGDWAAAARWWDARGCPYESAVAALDADDPAAVLRATASLDRLGARPAAAHGRRRLRALGVVSVPRGPRPATRTNAAGLTRREADVLELVAEGLTNGEIAARLFLSGKTVERHVSAVLRKLGVPTRSAAVAAARRAGVLRDEGAGTPS